MEQHDDGALVIYTDGSMLSSPRRQGGFGIRFVWCDEAGEEQTDDRVPFGFQGADVPQMELKAVIEAVKLLLGSTPPIEADQYEKVIIFTDATYVLDGFESSRAAWPKSGWRTRNGTPVRNADLWRELQRLVKRLRKRVDVRKVKAHKSNPHNKAVDRSARASARLPSDRMLVPAKIRRKTTDRSIEPGGITMTGQRVFIHVHKAQYERVQRLNSYRYSVESPESPDHAKVGRATSERDLVLSAGHRYDVRFNRDSKNPWILEVFSEVDANLTPLDP